MIEALAEALRARGDEFGFVVPDVAGATWHERVRAAGAELHVASGVREASRFARAWRPDVAHVHFFGWEPAVTLALWPSRARLFWHAHSTSLRAGTVRRTPRTLLKYRVLGARAERFVAVSSAIGDELVRLGAPARRVVVVRNEVDGRRFRAPAHAERDAARAAFGVDGPTVLFFGRDPHLKGADVLARALACMPGVTVLAVTTPESARAELARHARVIDVDRTDDVVPLFWAADVLAMPSRGEGLSFAQAEAVATALPVVASDLPALRDGADERTVFFASEDVDGLVQALRAALVQRRAVDLPPAPGDGCARWAANITALY